MNRLSGSFFSLFLCFVLSSCVLSADFDSTLSSSNSGPFIVNTNLLNRTKTAIQNGTADSTLQRAYQKLLIDAEKAFGRGPFSVVHKNHLPPSGNKHDYMTIATYYWPNPETENGLPYIYRDGRRNPEVAEYDRSTLSNFSSTVWTLSLAYFFTDNEEYADRVAYLVRYWFVNEDTYMTPHLKYGQAIAGRYEGTSSGIIETREFLNVLDGISLIYDSSSWKKEDQIQLKIWFDTYLDWLINSSLGRGEANHNNNHGTWYDLQVVTFALFTEEEKKARKILDQYFHSRIYDQLSANGAQVKELERTRSQYYTWFNLKAMLDLVALTHHINEQKESIGSADNFAAETTSLSSTPTNQVINALNWLVPYASNEQPWQNNQIKNFDRCNYFETYRKAAVYFSNPQYEKIANKLMKSGCRDNQIQLLYPATYLNRK